MRDEAADALRVLAVPADAAEARYALARAILGDEAAGEEVDELMPLLFGGEPTAGMVAGFVAGAR